jgi:hypothetical protein
MATTRRNRVGRIRERLAALILEALGTGYDLDPADLNSNIPWYARPQFDGCSWSGRGLQPNGLAFHVYSWDRMRDCVQNGFGMSQEDAGILDIEVSAKGPNSRLRKGG